MACNNPRLFLAGLGRRGLATFNVTASRKNAARA
jgi:hypothetical protein